MKRRIFILSIFIFFLFCLVGCGKTNSVINTTKKVETTTKAVITTTNEEVTTTKKEITTTIHSHDYGTIISQVNPTCTTDGALAHYVCSSCGKVFDSDKNETTMDNLKINALNHDYSTEWTIDKGVHYHVCTRCGGHDEDVNHTLVHHEKINATHTEDGVSEYYECLVCHGLFADEECNNQLDNPIVISATGHDQELSVHEKENPTCEATGTEKYYSCSCGKMFSDSNAQNEISAPIVINATGHQNITHHNRVAATHEEAGNIEYYECDVCHKKFADSDAKNEITDITINAIGHDENLTIHEKVNPTCENTGIEKYYSCSCGKLFSDSNAQNEISAPIVISATGHQNLAHHNRVDATCEEAGNIEYYECGICHKKFSDANTQNEITVTIINATGHTDLTHYDRVNPTCTETGLEEYYKCNTCKKLFSDSACKNEINAPTVIEATNHASFRHVTGYCSTSSSSSGFVDHYVCDDCGVVWQDENQTIVLGNMNGDTSKIEIPYSQFTYNLKKSSAVPYYNETYGVSFDTTLEPNNSVTFDIFGPQITDTNVKSVSIYVRNNSTYSVTMHIYDYTKAKRYLSSTPHSSNGWLKYTFSVEDYNSISYEGKDGFSVIVNSGATGDNGLFSIARLEYNYATAEEIALADSKLEQLNVVDDIMTDGYIKSYSEGLKTIEEIKEILGSSIPDALDNHDKLVSYYSLYNNYKVLFDASTQRFALDVMSSSYISSISMIEQNGLSLNKVSIKECQTNVLITTPNFTSSIRGQSCIIFRIYNPTSSKVTIGVHDSNYSNDPIYSIKIEPRTWETIQIDTSLFTTGTSMYIKLTPETDQSLEGDWLFTSIIHYSGKRRIIYGQGNNHKMTIYKAGWIASTKTEKDGMMVFRANLVGDTTDSTAIVELATLDAYLYDYVEFYVYNETGNPLTIKTHMQGNSTYYNFEETIVPGEWIRLVIDISIWNESRTTPTRYFEIYPLNNSDTVTGVVNFSYFYGVLK